PCIREQDIDRLIEEASDGDGGLLATPLRDTLKRADEQQCVAVTEPREDCWHALTPQMFRRGPLASALNAARDAGIAVTDESMAMEYAGFAPRLVEGHEDNIKITRPADLALAEFLLERLP
ncbi:MAG: 2-C-methyl-D-erythritol 4-phosphate cytidylyltransferase, partial [Rhodanobacteraceae bacterium]